MIRSEQPSQILIVVLLVGLACVSAAPAEADDVATHSMRVRQAEQRVTQLERELTSARGALSRSQVRHDEIPGELTVVASEARDDRGFLDQATRLYEPYGTAMAEYVRRRDAARPSWRHPIDRAGAALGVREARLAMQAALQNIQDRVARDGIQVGELSYRYPRFAGFLAAWDRASIRINDVHAPAERALRDEQETLSSRMPVLSAAVDRLTTELAMARSAAARAQADLAQARQGATQPAAPTRPQPTPPQPQPTRPQPTPAAALPTAPTHRWPTVPRYTDASGQVTAEVVRVTETWKSDLIHYQFHLRFTATPEAGRVRLQLIKRVQEPRVPQLASLNAPRSFTLGAGTRETLIGPEHLFLADALKWRGGYVATFAGQDGRGRNVSLSVPFRPAVELGGGPIEVRYPTAQHLARSLDGQDLFSHGHGLYYEAILVEANVRGLPHGLHKLFAAVNRKPAYTLWGWTFDQDRKGSTTFRGALPVPLGPFEIQLWMPGRRAVVLRGTRTPRESEERLRKYLRYEANVKLPQVRKQRASARDARQRIRGQIAIGLSHWRSARWLREIGEHRQAEGFLQKGLEQLAGSSLGPADWTDQKDRASAYPLYLGERAVIAALRGERDRTIDWIREMAATWAKLALQAPDAAKQKQWLYWAFGGWLQAADICALMGAPYEQVVDCLLRAEAIGRQIDRKLPGHGSWYPMVVPKAAVRR